MASRQQAAAGAPIAEATRAAGDDGAAPRHQVDPERLLGAEPRRQPPGRRRDWQAAQAALERLAGWSRHRHTATSPIPTAPTETGPAAA